MRTPENWPAWLAENCPDAAILSRAGQIQRARSGGKGRAPLPWVCAVCGAAGAGVRARWAHNREAHPSKGGRPRIARGDFEKKD
jgi:hypothetical protein